MKINQLLFVLLLLPTLLICKATDNKKIDLDQAARAYGLNTATGTAALATAQYTHPIIPAQINNTGYYAVKNAGYYFLTEDLFFAPRAFIDNSVPLNVLKAIIYVQKDNVIIDLNSKTILQKNNKSQSFLDVADLHAIYIQDGVKNVTIKNGTINFATGHGIYIGKGCSNIVLSNVQIINCGLRGINAQGESDNKIQDITIENCHVSNCSGTIQPDTTLHGDITNGHAIGIDLTYVENSFITETISNNNQIEKISAQSNSTTDSIAAGIRMQNCQNITCKSCLCNNNAGPTGQGFYALQSSNLTFQECKADENHVLFPTGTPSTTVADGIGFHLEASNYCSFYQCQANHNSTSTRHGVGFYLNGTTDNGNSNFNNFQNCTAMSNEGGKTTAESSIGAGFLSYGKDNDNYNIGNSFMKCLSKGNMCLAETTESSPSNYNKALGIGLLFEDGSVIESCKCIGNGNFLSTDTVTQTSQDGNIEVPHVLGYGIYLGPEGKFVDSFSDEYTTANYTYTKNIIINDCWLMFNSRAGLKDDAKDCQSLIMRNYAFRNGTQNKNLSQGDLSLYATNYQVQYLQPNEKLTVTTATVGGFGALNVANPYANLEWQVSDTSYGHWDVGSSPTTIDTLD